MKRKIIACAAAAALAVCFTAGLASCSEKYPDSTTIDGETYVKGFLDDLYFTNFTYRENDTALFDTDNHYWWKVDGAPYDMYCARHKESWYWDPVVYCKESQLDEVKAYYNDTANYDYYIGIYLDDTVQIKLEGADTALLESAIATDIKIDNGFATGGLLDEYKDIRISFPFEERTDVIGSEDSTKTQPVLYRVSKDGFFTTSQGEWLIYQDNFYVCGMCIDDLQYAYKIDEAASAYIISLFTQYGLLA